MRSEAEIREVQRGAELAAASYIHHRKPESASSAIAAAVVDDFMAWVLGDVQATERVKNLVEFYKKAARQQANLDRAQRQ